MRIHVKFFPVLLSVLALLVAPTLHPQAATGALARNTARPELAATFDYVHSNAPAGGCGCFAVYGGSLSLAVPIRRGPFALIASVASGQSPAIDSGSDNLRLSRFMAGARYTPYLPASRLRPFAQAAVGFAHASQSLVSGAATPNAAATLAVALGGGVDLGLNRRWSVRLIDADYLLTKFDNGSNNRQNNLALGAGVVVHF